MILLIVCGLCAQKLWRVRTFSGIHIELKRFLFPKLSEDKKKGSSTRTGVVYCVQIYVKTKKRSSASIGAVFVAEKFIVCLIIVLF